MIFSFMKLAKNTNRVQKQATRDKILQGAIEVFSNYPYGTASVRMVGRAAGVDHPLVSYHFPSKAVLFEEVIDSVFGDFFQAHVSWFDGLGQRGNEADMEARLDRMIEYVSEQPAAFRIVALNLVQPEGHEVIPGYDGIQTFVTKMKQTLTSNVRLQGSAEDLDRLINSFNVLAVNYLGAGSYYAGKLGLKPESLEYRKWVKETLMFLFLPRYLEFVGSKDEDRVVG